MKSILLSVGLLSCLTNAVFAGPDDLSPQLKKLLAGSKMPSLAAAAVHNGKLVAAGAAGVRKRGVDVEVTVEDKYHIGSCTKSMTATLAAILVEDGVLKWDTTVADVFRDVPIHENYRGTTLVQLLSHSGGCPANPPMKLMVKWQTTNELPVKQRMTLVNEILSKKPAYEAGNGYTYSNAGYGIAGAMMETLTGKPWEEMLSEKLLKPLGMTSAGFRAPGDAKAMDQPWGHNPIPIPPIRQADNPAAIGPAGAVHCSIGDWAKYATFHLESKPGQIIRKRATFDQLHKLHNKAGKYGLGWIVFEAPGLGKVLQHGGSNTMWFALIWIVPEKNFAAVATTNSGQKGAFELCDKAIATMMGRYLANAKK